MQIIIGNKNYSSWSLRPWLLLKHFGVPFEEVVIPLFTEGFEEKIAKYSPTRRVPVLRDGASTLWDSLAICEYIAEKYLKGQALPLDIEERGLCRSYCSEMHSGFFAIRSEMPMNCRARKSLQISAAANAECERVDQLFSEARARFGHRGEYLFGDFSLADCMFAPIVMRFLTYGIGVSQSSQNYIDFMLMNPALRAWVEAARKERQILPDYELGEEVSP
ncbi:MAG: glutathione S-transferase family protein [Pseudohongiellaceae bacterium]